METTIKNFIDMAPEVLKTDEGVKSVNNILDAQDILNASIAQHLTLFVAIYGEKIKSVMEGRGENNHYSLLTDLLTQKKELENKLLLLLSGR